MKKTIKKVFWIYTMLFVVLVGYLCKVSLADSKNYITNSFNPRLNKVSEYIKRGDILDANGQVLAYSQKDENGIYHRYYNESNVFSNITGYTSKGKTGVEAKYNFMLETVSSELTQRIKDAFAGTECVPMAYAGTQTADVAIAAKIPLEIDFLDPEDETRWQIGMYLSFAL